MAHPLRAYYGRKTYAFLDRCCFCGKPYHESNEWTTMQGGKDESDVWLLVCGPCMEKQEENES